MLTLVIMSSQRGPSGRSDSFADDKQDVGRNRLFEINIPVRKQGDVSFDAEDQQRQKMVALHGNLNPEGNDETDQVMEVYYNDGATELFLALEDTDWRKALNIIHQKPQQAKVWVISTGTVETTFGWSLWRRLPLHEACRRQGPAWLISALLSVYPLAAEQTTQFGELPLHLAVECGAPPEVVNLLVVTHWHGIMATDQSGRTPLEILQDSEMLAMEDHQVVFESLTRSQETYQTISEEHQEEVKGIKVRHAAGLVAIRQQHDEDLQQEQDQQEKLLAEVERLKSLVDDAKLSNKKDMDHIQQLSQAVSNGKNNMSHLHERLNSEIASGAQKAARITSLEQELAGKNQDIVSLKSQIHELQGDLQRIAGWQQDVLARQINSTEESMQTMVEQFVGLVDLLSGQSQRMSSVLKSRNIAMPPPKPKQPRSKKEEKKEDAPVETLDEDTLNNIAAVASSALQS